MDPDNAYTKHRVVRSTSRRVYEFDRGPIQIIDYENQNGASQFRNPANPALPGDFTNTWLQLRWYSHVV